LLSLIVSGTVANFIPEQSLAMIRKSTGVQLRRRSRIIFHKSVIRLSWKSHQQSSWLSWIVEESLKLKEVLDLTCVVNVARCSSEAVNLFMDPRCRFIVTPHPARMYRQFPRVYIHLYIVQMMDLCLTNNRLPQKSESLKIYQDRYSPPESLWSREVARWLFVEVWITATFLLEMNRVCLFGEQVFEEIREDVQDDHLHLAIAEGGSFTEMSLSLLARFDCRDFGGRTSKVYAKFVIEPRLKRTVTPDTKFLV
jgi:hypothetical protein